MTSILGSYLDHIKENGHVSVVELRAIYEREVGEACGDVALELAPNIVIWADMSQGFADSLKALTSESNVTVDPASPLVYMIDGAMLKLPVAKRPPVGGYKELHWLPVCFNTAHRVKMN